MPPSPRLKLSLVEDRFEDLCASMGLQARPRVRFVPTSGRILGRWNPLRNMIEIWHGQVFFEANRLRAVNAELVDTLLHELRHAWQDEQHGIGWYDKNVVKAENDANEFAQANYHKWRGVLRVSRTASHRRLPA